jgi:hypothetical protein
MEFKDYYKIMGVARDATRMRSSAPIVPWRANIILM